MENETINHICMILFNNRGIYTPASIIDDVLSLARLDPKTNTSQIKNKINDVDRAKT